MSLRLIADAMLGTLAKWLRLLGYDTLFDPGWDDDDLVRLARAEERVLLTRDGALSRRRGVRVLWIRNEDLKEQVRQVLADLELAPAGSFSRCPVCNVSLQDLDHAAAQSRVPAYVHQTQEKFKICSHCQRVYWRGTHWQRMVEQLAQFQTADAAVPLAVGTTSEYDGG